jgi:hypothetical protein
MPYETTLVAVAIIVITAVIAWYCRLFDQNDEEDDFEGDEGSTSTHHHCVEPTVLCSARHVDGGAPKKDASHDARRG